MPRVTSNPPPELAVYFFESNGNKDLFIAKYSQGGVLSWVKNLGSVGDDMGTGVTCDALGNVYLTATYSDSLTFVTKNFGHSYIC